MTLHDLVVLHDWALGSDMWSCMTLHDLVGLHDWTLPDARCDLMQDLPCVKD